jgi:hypothetical protein
MPQSGLTDIGKYRIIELIGEGSMGVVYRAFDPVLARPVAIKVMTDALAREPELRDRFVREARSLSPPASVLPQTEQRSGAAPPTTGPPSVPPRPHPPPPELARNPEVEIAGVIADYARAISSRDIARVRRAYPGMTAGQERGFVQFFQSVRSLRAELSVSGLELAGAAAGARVVGVDEFVGHDGTLQRQPIAFQARLEEIGGHWQLVAVQE